MSGGQTADFDLQAAWLRRSTADAGSNLNAFALRLKEALPDRVTIKQSKGFFTAAKTTGVSVELGDNRYTLDLVDGRLKANVALVVRGIALNTRSVDPAAWFARLTEETKSATEHAHALSQSLSMFMAS